MNIQQRNLIAIDFHYFKTNFPIVLKLNKIPSIVEKMAK